MEAQSPLSEVTGRRSAPVSTMGVLLEAARTWTPPRIAAQRTSKAMLREPSVNAVTSRRTELCLTDPTLVAAVGPWVEGTKTCVVSDAALLVRIAKEAGGEEISMEAAARITDQTLLAEVAKESRHSWVRIAAAERLANQSTAQEKFAEISRTYVHILAPETHRWARLAAAERLADEDFAQGALAEIAKSEMNDLVRIAAAEKLVNQDFAQEVFAKIAMCRSVLLGAREGEKALSKLADQVLIARVAVKACSPYCRELAFEKLTDQAGLAEVAMRGNSDDEELRQRAVFKLTDQVLLDEVVRSHHLSEGVRRTAGRRLLELRRTASERTG